MKKYMALICAILAVCLLAGCGADGEKKNARETEKQEKTVSVECLVSTESDYGDYTVSYEPDGVLLSPMELVDAYVELYTPDGREVYSIYYNEEGVQRHRMDSTYNEDGLVAEKLQTNLIENEVAYRYVYSYDSWGNLLRLDSYVKRDFPNGYNAYTYDDRGFPVSFDYYDHEDTNLWHYDFTCDDSGRIVTAAMYYPLRNNTLTQLGYHTCTYDDAGRLVSQIWTLTNRSYFVFKSYYYTYDAAGRLTNARVVFEDGDVESDTVYTYDDQGRLTGITEAVDGYSLTLTYGTVELPAELAESARIWSTEGVIQYAAPMPEYER